MTLIMLGDGKFNNISVYYSRFDVMILRPPPAVSHRYLHLAVAGLPRPGFGPLPGLRALLAAGLHDTRIQDERSHNDHRPPHGAGGRSHSQTGKGTQPFF